MSVAGRALAIPHILEKVIDFADFVDLASCATVHSTWFKLAATRLYDTQVIAKDRHADPVVPWALRAAVDGGREPDNTGDDETGRVAWAADIALKCVRRIQIKDHDHGACHRRYSPTKQSRWPPTVADARGGEYKVDTIELDVFLLSDNYCAFFCHFSCRRLIIRQHPLPTFDYQNPSGLPALEPIAEIVVLLIDQSCFGYDGYPTLAASSYPAGATIIVRLPHVEKSGTKGSYFCRPTGHAMISRAFARLYKRGPCATYIVLNAERPEYTQIPAGDLTGTGEPMTLPQNIESQCDRLIGPEGKRYWYTMVNDRYMTMADFKASPYHKDTCDIVDFDRYDI